MSSQPTPPSRPPLHLVNDNTPNQRPAEAPHTQLSAMEKLEIRSQPYIVITMAIAAAVRSMYIFTDKLINIAAVVWLNGLLSIATGLALAIISELTVSIAGRRHKRYKKLLYQAEQSHAVAKRRDKDLWAVEIKQLKDNVASNIFMTRVAIGMSFYAGASYLLDSVGAHGSVRATLISTGIALLSASGIAAYILYLMYYHGVQTDEIAEDRTGATAIAIEDALNMIRIEEMQRLRADLNEAQLSFPARLALIASGLPVTTQRMVLPTVKLLLGKTEAADDVDEDDTASWWTMRQVALYAGEDFHSGRKPDDITRKYRRRLAENAEKFPDDVRLDPVRGWIVKPEFALRFWQLPDAPSDGLNSQVVDSTIEPE